MMSEAFDYGEYRLRAVADEDQSRLLRWRNHPEVRRNMINDQLIAADEHRAWWSRVERDPTRRWFLLERGDEPVAVINYYDLTVGEGAEGWWGFYLTEMERRDGAERMRLWVAAEEVALRHAFERLGLERLLCETFAFNTPVLALHRRFGLQEIERRSVERGGREQTLVVTAVTPATLRGLSPPACSPAEPTPGPERDDPPRRVAFLGSANWALAAASFERLSEREGAGATRVTRLPFGQWRMALAEGALADHDYLIFCERFEDLLAGAHACAAATLEAALDRRIDDYLAQIRAARERSAGRFLVLDLAPVRPYPESLEAFGEEASSVAALVRRLNRRLRDGLEALPDGRLLALSSLIERFGAGPADPGKYWHLGRAPFHGRFIDPLGRRLLGAMLAWEGAGARLLVLDLDNTLWGGVVGDDGLEGIRLGGDHPGSLFSAFQHYLKRLRERGVALAVASKNSEAVALEALRDHPAMVLRPEDFVAMRINWAPKPGNLVELAEEVGVGLGSLLFIDDNPLERAEVRAALPEVAVAELPTDPAEWPVLLSELPALASFTLTAEDRERAERYQQRAAGRREEGRFASREAFLGSLGLRLTLHGAEPAHWQRILQLIAKTNQFNATTRRHGEQALRGLLARGGEIVAAGLSDHHSDEEIVGVAILRFPREGVALIDSFILSCRVLGRGVETALLAALCERLRGRGVARLEGEIIETARNVPVRGLYADHGFRALGEGRWSLDLECDGVVAPSWFEDSRAAG